MGRRKKVAQFEGLTWDVDFSEIDKIKKSCKVVNRRHIQWGYLSPRTYPPGDPNGRAGWLVSYQAAILELGLDVVKDKKGGKRKLPARPFFTQSIAGAILLVDRIIERFFLDVLACKDMDGDLARLATMLEWTVRLSIDSQNFAPLSDFTLEQKEKRGANMSILRDTNYMYFAVESKVLKNAQSDEYKPKKKK